MRSKSKIPAKYNNKPTFTIIGDGQTEKWYFDMMQRTERDLNIIIKPRLTVKKTLEEQFKNIISEANKSKIFKKDKVFWIIDFDTILGETREAKKGKKSASQELKEYCEKLQNHSVITIIINNPCLEFWFLLHYELTYKPFNNCDAAQKQLLKYLPDYEKTEKYFTKQNNDIYSKLLKSKNTAIENIKKLPEFDFDNASRSVSQMHKFFDEISNSKEKK